MSLSSFWRPKWRAAKGRDRDVLVRAAEAGYFDSAVRWQGTAGYVSKKAADELAVALLDKPVRFFAGTLNPRTWVWEVDYGKWANR